MPRANRRTLLPGYPLHVLQRGHNKTRCFADDTDHDLYLGLLQEFSKRHACAIHEVLTGADTGGLMSYGHDIDHLYKRAAYFIDRVLRGTKPGDIPIEQPKDYEFRVNLKAAKAIGLALPASVVLQATRLIE